LEISIQRETHLAGHLLGGDLPALPFLHQDFTLFHVFSSWTLSPILSLRPSALGGAPACPGRDKTGKRGWSAPALRRQRLQRLDGAAFGAHQLDRPAQW